MIDTAMHVSAWPDAVTADSGGAAQVTVVVTNVAEVIDAYSIDVLGVDPDWVTTSLDRVSLFPGESQQVDLAITIPNGYPAAERLLTITVRSLNDAEHFRLATVALTIPPVASTSIKLDPPVVTSGRAAEYGLVITNDGNAPVLAVGVGVDPEELAKFRIEPPQVLIAPGQTEVIQIQAKGGRAWFGNPRARMFAVGVEAEDRIETTATFIQRPRIARWVLTLLGLLAAATVFLFVLSTTFVRVVNEASVADGVIDDALSTGEAGGAKVPANPGTVTGVLTTSTNRELIAEAGAGSGFQSGGGSSLATGVAAVQVELFLADDPTLPVASAATDDGGRFTLANLGKGEYLLLLSGAGYPDVWFVEGGPAAAGPADASPIVVDLGTTTDLGDIQIGGIPVTIEGTVGGDAAGATLKLVRTGVLDPDVPALLAEVTIGADGSFTLPDIPSPADLEMLVEKPGFAPVRRKVTLQPGDELGDISIQLTPAEGQVTGKVVGTDGPLGGVTIIATDGQYRIETVSYTDGDVGAFTLRNLSTPGRYTVTAEAPGYVPQTQTATLSAGQSVVQLPTMSLVPATGKISGAVSVEGRASGDVVITLTGGPNIERTTRPISGNGPLAGVFLIDGLPSPATYTLTFASESALTQVRVVALDPTSGNSSAELAPIELRLENRSVRGRVLELQSGPSTGDAVSGAEVVLSDGVTSRKIFSANDPIGAFAFSNVPPGSYTLTATRDGALATVVPITVEPGTDVTGIELRLAKQASLVGRVDTGGGACDLVVRLFEFGNFDTEAAREISLVNGEYEFLAVRAPIGYLVAVYTRGSTDPLATTSVTSRPSTEVPVPTIDVSAACLSLGRP